MSNSFRSNIWPLSGFGKRALAMILGMAMGMTNAAQAESRQGFPSTPEPANGEVSPRGHRTATDITYGGWRKLCFKAAGAETLCRTSITGKFDTGQIAVRLDLIEREGGRARIQLFLPVGLYLQAGVKLSVDKGRPFPIPYTWCLTNGCVAADVAEPDLIKRMESGQTLGLEMVDTNILSLTTAVPLSQFALVRGGVPERIFEQDVDE